MTMTTARIETTGPHAAVTPRERDVLRVLIRGLTNLEIADELRISSNTVRAHLRAVSQGTGRSGRLAIALWAVMHWDCCVCTTRAAGRNAEG